MGRKRKAYPDKFKIDAVREALHSGADRTEVAIKYNIAQSTLSEWITMFLEGKILTDEQKVLEEKIAILEKQQETILMELGKKQLEIDLLKKNGAKLTISEQCKQIEVKTYGCLIRYFWKKMSGQRA